MPNSEGLDPNTGVAQVFTAILATLEQLDWQQEAPDVFLVYAHDNSDIKKPADATTARQIIEWLRQVGANIYSDRTGMGNPPIPKATPLDTVNTANAHDILISQLGLLPTNRFMQPEEKRQAIILCGSALLNHYESSRYCRETYYPEFKKAYYKAEKQADPREAKAILSQYVNSQLQQPGFHHILTELACLQLRIEREPHHHGIIPLLLNKIGDQEGFPRFIMDLTTIRIKESVYRQPSQWENQTTYQDQGLHQAFFKLLKRLWENKERIIQEMTIEVYATCLTALKKQPLQEQTFISDILKAIQDAQKRLINEGCSMLRRITTQELLHKNNETRRWHLNHSKFEIEKQLSEWYTSLSDGSMADRLAIQRISGYPLPMEHCYINLGVVAYQPKQNEDMEDQASNPLFYRLRSAEAVTNTNTFDPIALADLFKPRRLKNGVEEIPKRILIRGRAGIGKTTLAKKSMYDHIHHQHWGEHFNYVLWIRLRHLKGKPTNYSLRTLLYDEYFEGYSSNGHDLAELLHEQLQQDPHKTLFILDGWDEIVQEPFIGCLHTLVNHPRVIITSRPHGVSVKTFQNIDLELETIGFSQANVMAYLDHPEIVDDPNAATAIKAFIQQHPFVRELVNIPIQLDALCDSWELIQDRPQRAETMTGLYQVMIEQLWRKDIVRLRKQENGTALTKEAVQSIRRFTRLEPLVREEIVYLEALALNGLYESRIEFSCDDLDDLTEQLVKEHQLPLDLERNVTKLSCLEVEKAKGSYRAQSYQFLHLTFQEFFSAQSIAKAFTQGKRLGLVKAPTMTADAFIRQYKYDPRYEIVWWLVAGILEGEQLVQFFGLLDEEPQDLIGIQHQYLVMHCLRESHNKLPKHQKQSLRSHLSDWLDVEIMTMLSGEGTSNLSDPFLPDSLLTISHLGSQDAFPEEFLMEWLTKECVTVAVKKIILNTLQKRHRCSHSAIQALIRLLEDTDPKVRELVARALGRQSPLASAGVEALIRLLEHTDSEVKKAAALALGAQSPLDPAGVEALIRLLQDKDSEVREAAALALGRQSPLASAGVEALIRLLQDSDPKVSRSATRALEKQSPLAPEFVEALIRLLQDTDPTARWWAAEALGRQSPLAPEFVEALIRLLEHTDSRVRAATTGALEQQSPLPPGGVEALIRLLQDSDPGVREAAEALVRQSPLAPAGVEALIRLLQDSELEVRQSATRALEKQSPLAPAGVEALIRLLQDPELGVRKDAAKALGRQSPLAPAGVEALIRLLQDPELGVRKAAAEALGQQSPLAPAGVEALIRLLQDSELGVRKAAAEALGQQSPLAPAGVEALIRLLQDTELGVRKAATEALGQQSPLAPAGVEALIRLLQDPELGVREAAAKALGCQSPLAPAGVKALIRSLQDPDPGVREAAAEALGLQSPLAPAGVEALIRLLEHTDSRVREAAVEALGRQSPLAPAEVKALIRLLQDPELGVKETAAKALGRQSPLAPAGVEALIRLLQDTEPGVRKSAAWTLGLQSSLATAGVEALIRLLQDTEPRVRETAAEALGLQSSLATAGVEALIRLLQDTEPRVREAAAEAVEQQSPLATAGVKALIRLLQDAAPQVRKEITFVLNYQDSWNIYRLLPTMNPSLLTAVYSHSMISYNFKQPAPLYLQSGVLHFYTPEGLETIPLNEKDISFKQAILKAQQAISIPKSSQIRLQSSFRTQSSESYDRFFRMPGAWPLENDYQPTLGL